MSDQIFQKISHQIQETVYGARAIKSDNHGNKVFGQLLQCNDGRVLEYGDDIRRMDFSAIADAASMAETRETMFSGSWELGDFPSPLALRCGNHPTATFER